MSYAEDLRNEINYGCSKTVRAVIYARVSTDNDGQRDSCVNQVALAKKYVTSHPNIQIVGIFIDDGISGKNDFTRPQYNAMLQMISEGKVDLIITKALSRLNRDQLNSLMLRSLLVDHEATVLTLEDNQIHDFEDMGSELLHSISFAIDAQYVRRQSINGKKTQELRCARKELSAKDCQSLGYLWHKETKTITINEEEAAIVREIFEGYVYRNETPTEIQRKLKAKGINMVPHTIGNILRDERYIGKFYINKRTSKLGTGQTKSKRIPLPKEQWILVDRPDLQIIDTELFRLAQHVHQARITTYGIGNETTRARFRGYHKYARKIFCPVCGRPYHFHYSDRNKKVPVYRIANHDCSNPMSKVYENDIDNITKKVLEVTIGSQDEIYSHLEAMLTDCVRESQDSMQDIFRLKTRKKSLEDQSDSLVEALSDGRLSDKAKEKIKDKLNIVMDEVDAIECDIKTMESSKLEDSYVPKKIAQIKAAMEELRKFKELDRNSILTYVDKIEVFPDSSIHITLKTLQSFVVSQKEDGFFECEDVVTNGKQDVPCP